MNAYVVLKHLHVTCVILSVTGFLLRGLLMLRESPLLGRRWVRTVPHLNDILLLAAAIGLSVITAQYPFVHGWVTAKIFGLIAYIILGSVALKAGRTKDVRVTAWLVALGCFGYIVSVALTKNPLGVLALI